MARRRGLAEEPATRTGIAAWIGRFAGPAAALVCLVLPAPAGLSPAGWHTAAVALWMAIWWMTEAVPLPLTSLLPLGLFPALGILTLPRAARPYAHELIFLFLGGFLLAGAMQRWGLHRRIALSVLGAFGTGARQVVLGFMAATALLSMWISNTATAAMMLPIGMGVARRLSPQEDGGRLGVSLMLGIAYAASIGGVATLIGTPPNTVLAATVSELVGKQIGFVQWMVVGVPLALVLLPAAWALLVFVLHPPGEVVGGADALIARERAELGSVSRGERAVAVAFGAAAFAWVLRAPKPIGPIVVPGITTWVPWVSDATIAMTAALVLFVVPIDLRRRVFAADASVVRSVPWGVLILFGGGLSLARAMADSGLSAWIGGLVSGLAGFPGVLVVAVVATLFVLLTEITSNSATATMAMPVMAAAAAGLGMDPVVLMTTAALAASMAFMLPVATPPNAIVFGSGWLTVRQMAGAGWRLNLVAIVLITVAGVTLIPWVLG